MGSTRRRPTRRTSHRGAIAGGARKAGAAGLRRAERGGSARRGDRRPRLLRAARRCARACRSSDAAPLPTPLVFDERGLRPGALWSEAHQGTNAIGAALVEERALTIHRDQHFHTRNTGAELHGRADLRSFGTARGGARRLLLPRDAGRRPDQSAFRRRGRRCANDRGAELPSRFRRCAHSALAAGGSKRRLAHRGGQARSRHRRDAGGAARARRHRRAHCGAARGGRSLRRRSAGRDATRRAAGRRARRHSPRARPRRMAMSPRRRACWASAARRCIASSAGSDCRSEPSENSILDRTHKARRV